MQPLQSSSSALDSDFFFEESEDIMFVKEGDNKTLVKAATVEKLIERLIPDYPGTFFKCLTNQRP